MEELWVRVQELLSRKGIPSEIVIAVYLVGSRLFQCHTKESDFDLIAVVDDAANSTKWSEDYGNRGPAGLLLIEEDDLNINIYHIRYFESLMQDNVVWIAMTYFSPPSAILFLRNSCHPVPFHLKKLNLKRVALMDSEHNFLKAKKLIKENVIKKAKKNLIHGVRFLKFALQLFQYEKIIDFTAGNEEWNMISDDPSEDWKHYEQMFKPIYNSLSQQVHSQAIPRIQELPKRQLDSISLLEVAGPECFRKELSINVIKLDNLLFFYSDAMNSPSSHKIAQECSNGLLLNGLTPICYPYEKVEEIKEIVSMNETFLLDFEKGRLITLFFYDSWKICSSDSPDACVPLIQNQGHYQYPSRRYYNAWDFFDESLMQTRRAYLSNVTNVGNKEMEGWKTLKEAFWDTWENLGYELPRETHLCFMFEFTAKSIGLHVVQSQTMGNIVLTGVRDMNTLQEIPISKFHGKFNWRFLSPLPMTSEEAEEFTRSLDPTKARGLLLLDNQGNRKIVHSSQYSAIKKLCWLDSLDPSRKLLMLDIVRTNQHKSFLIHFPQFEELYKQTELHFQQLCETLQNVVDSLPPFEDRKEFGTAVSKIKWKTLIFDMFNLKMASVKTYLSRLSFIKLVEVLKNLGQNKVKHDLL